VGNRRILSSEWKMLVSNRGIKIKVDPIDPVLWRLALTFEWLQNYAQEPRVKRVPIWAYPLAALLLVFVSGLLTHWINHEWSDGLIGGAIAAIWPASFFVYRIQEDCRRVLAQQTLLRLDESLREADIDIEFGAPDSVIDPVPIQWRTFQRQ